MDAAMRQPAESGGPNLTIEKLSEGQIACLKFYGTLDEGFEGKKLSASVKGNTLIVDLGNVVKISSFGLREWADFIRGVEKSVKDIYIIECTPRVVDQLNMVANFAGKGLVYSFYAPYRCDYCDVDRQVLFQVDRDRDAVKGMKPPEQPCETCGNPEYLDEDPATFFSYLAGQRDFELDAAVGSFVASKLGYTISEAPRRLQVEKYVNGRNTYLKLLGNLDGSFPREKIAEGLEGTIVLDVSGVGMIDPAGAAEWRGFIGTVAPTVDKIFLLGCPPMFLERLTRPEDLGDNAEVLSFAMPYACATCSTTVSKRIDVDEHFDILKFATPPEMKCDDCQAATTCVASETLLSHLPTLPKPTLDAGLRKFVKEAQQQKREKLTQPRAEKATGGSPRFLVTLLSALVVAAIALVVLVYYNQQQFAAVQQNIEKQGAAAEPSLIDERPEWIASGVPGSAYCADQINRLTCVGVSTYRLDKQKARIEAINAAKESLADAVALKIEGDAFDDHVRSLYADSRREALSQLEAVRGERDSEAYAQAMEAVRRGRRNVALALDETGGAAIPSQPTDWYWEEYKVEDGEGTEFLAFTRFDLGVDAAKRLIERYGEPAEVLGAKALTLFPSLAWKYPTLSSGAILADVGDGMLADFGLKPHDVIISIRGESVRDASDFADRMKAAYRTRGDHGGTIRFTAEVGEDEPKTFDERP